MREPPLSTYAPLFLLNYYSAEGRLDFRHILRKTAPNDLSTLLPLILSIILYYYANSKLSANLSIYSQR